MINSKFNCRNCRWNKVTKSSLGEKYLSISRPVSMSYMKRHNGQMVTKIDVLKSEVPLKFRN